jgi:hypothetical protein
VGNTIEASRGGVAHWRGVLGGGGGSAEECTGARLEERRVTPVVGLVGTEASWWSSRMERRHQSTRQRGGVSLAWTRSWQLRTMLSERPAFKGTQCCCIRSAHGIDVLNDLRQVGLGGNEEGDRWAALQWFSNSKITAGIELSTGKIAKG